MAAGSRGGDVFHSIGTDAAPRAVRILRPVGILALALLLMAGTALLAVVAHPPASVPAVALVDHSTAPVVSPENRGGPVGPLGIVNSIRVGSAPTSIAYDSGKHELFVVNSNSNNVSVIADGTGLVVATIEVGSFPYGAAYDPARNEVYVTNTGSNNVSVISDAMNTVVTSVQLGVGDWPTGIVYDSAQSALFVANTGTNAVVEISDSSNSVINSVSAGMGASPLELTYDAGLGQIFVTLYGTARVLVIVDSTLMTASINVGTTPMGIAYDSAKSEIFVANNGSNSVSVIADANDTVVSTVPLTSNPTGVAYGPGTGEVAVTFTQTFSSTTFAMLALIADANNTVVTTVGLLGGGAANAVVYDSHNSGWYVADTAVGYVVVVAGNVGYQVTFTEAGLPAGVGWQVWFNGTGPWGRSESLYYSSASSLRLTAGNGSYTFAVMPLAGYRASPASGPITVAGAAVSQAIAFTFLYAVTFTETGLPAGTSWSVTLAGVSESSSTSTISFSEGNGTHAFSVGAVSGYDASPGSGNLTVTGAAASQAVTFSVSSSGAPGLFGLPGYTGLALIIVIVVVVAVVGFLLLRRQRGKAPPSSGTPPTSPGTPPP